MITKSCLRLDSGPSMWSGLGNSGILIFCLTTSHLDCISNVPPRSSIRLYPCQTSTSDAPRNHTFYVLLCDLLVWGNVKQIESGLEKMVVPLFAKRLQFVLSVLIVRHGLNSTASWGVTCMHSCLIFEFNSLFLYEIRYCLRFFGFWMGYICFQNFLHL